MVFRISRLRNSENTHNNVPEPKVSSSVKNVLITKTVADYVCVYELISKSSQL